MNPSNLKIGVYGSATNHLADSAKLGAKKIGKVLAKHGITVVTGGCVGLPHEAVLGASEVGGKCIGFSPTSSLEAHQKANCPTKGFSELRFVPSEYEHIKDIRIARKYRNISSVAYVDAALIIGGRTGTLNEFTIAYDLEKPIAILEHSGGITEHTIRVLLEDIDKPSKSEVIYDSDPTLLVKRLLDLLMGT